MSDASGILALFKRQKKMHPRRPRKIPDAIDENKRWFRGPGFLYLPETDWPRERSHHDEEDAQEVLHTKEENAAEEKWLPDPSRFSKY